MDQRGREQTNGGKDVLPFSFSVDVQREVLYRDWIREMNTIESLDSLALKLKEEPKSCGTATRRIWSERMSRFVTVSSSCLRIGCLFIQPCLAAMMTCEGQLPNMKRHSLVSTFGEVAWTRGIFFPFFCLPVFILHYS